MPRHSSTVARGKDAEILACNYLLNCGLSLIQRNFRSRCGEIDLIMSDRDSLVFVEVRYRRQSRFGSAAESVGPRKQSKIVACAQHYMQRNPAAADRPCRFDVVAISGTGMTPDIQWIPDAFPASV